MNILLRPDIPGDVFSSPRAPIPGNPYLASRDYDCSIGCHPRLVGHARPEFAGQCQQRRILLFHRSQRHPDAPVLRLPQSELAVLQPCKLEHTPLVKLQMALTIGTLGDNNLGIRLPSILAGVLAVPSASWCAWLLSRGLATVMLAVALAPLVLLFYVDQRQEYLFYYAQVFPTLVLGGSGLFSLGKAALIAPASLHPSSDFPILLVPVRPEQRLLLPSSGGPILI